VAEKQIGQLEHVISDRREWPINKLSEDLDEFLRGFRDESVARVLKRCEESSLKEALERTVYLEKIRLTQKAWKVDKPKDKRFWNTVKAELAGIEDDENAQGQYEQLLRKIVDSYTEEINGHFDLGAYNIAERILPRVFNRLLNTASARNAKRLWSNKYHLTERLKTMGHISEVRNLITKGTVIMVPTHSSNLDSILIGWIFHTLGLPAFLYGAGLNLFTNPVLSYFLRNLGSYRIDRRKKNLIYLETLKAYSELTVQRGCHSIFFPGGTRSRSGQLEDKVKLGLLGTLMTAQRKNFTDPSPHAPSEKIFVVPVIMSYHFVLEAGILIKDYLKRTGKEKFYEKPVVFQSSKKLGEFIWKFFSNKSEIITSIGRPMDVFGNEVDEEGNSIDSNGRIIDVKSYFVTDGEVKADSQRDFIYTKMLGEKIVERYKAENFILSSNLIAYAAFVILNKKHRKLDLFGLLRLPEEDRVIPMHIFSEVVEKLRDKLKEMEDAGAVKLAPHMYGDVHRLIRHGMSNLGMYHPKKALKENEEGNITCEDMNLLYFYHNRMDCYELEQYV